MQLQNTVTKNRDRLGSLKTETAASRSADKSVKTETTPSKSADKSKAVIPLLLPRTTEQPNQTGGNIQNNSVVLYNPEMQGQQNTGGDTEVDPDYDGGDTHLGENIQQTRGPNAITPPPKNDRYSSQVTL